MLEKLLYDYFQHNSSLFKSDLVKLRQKLSENIKLLDYCILNDITIILVLSIGDYDHGYYILRKGDKEIGRRDLTCEIIEVLLKYISQDVK